MNSSASLTNWQARGGTWLSKALRRLDLLRTSDGNRTVEPYGLLRLVGLRRQYWHGDAAFPGRLDPMPVGDIPLSAMHPLSVGGTTLLAVLRNSGRPVQIFIPPQFLAIWRGDLEHAGDEFLQAENLTLFAYLNPPTSLFEVERGSNGENLTFGTRRPHSKARLMPRSTYEHLLPIKKRSALRAP